MMSSRPFGIVAGLALALSLAPRAAAQSPAAQVRDVDVEGVRGLPESVVRAVIHTRETRCRSFFYAPACLLGIGGTRQRAPLDTIEVRQDVERIDSLYRAWGYTDARATSEIRPVRGGVAVRFTVAEGEPVRVRSVAVRGLDAMQPAVDVPTLPLRAGTAYAIPLLEQSQRLLAGAAAERGHAFASVEASATQDPATRTADVVLEVLPGPVAVFGTTQVAPQPPVREADVRQRLAYQPGERFDPGKLRRTNERLYALPVVQEARIDPVPTTQPGDSSVNLRIAVTPTRVGAFQLEGVVSSSSCIGGQGYVSSRYFLGAPRVVTFSAGATNLLNAQLRGFPCTGGAGGDFSQPGWFVSGQWREPVDADTWVLLDASVRRESSPRAYVLSGVNGRAAVTRGVAEGLDVFLGVAPERSDNQAAAAFFCGVYGACSGAPLAALTGATTLLPLQGSLTWQRPAVRPQLGAAPPGADAPRWLQGVRLTVSAASRSLVSDRDYAQGVVQANVARRLGARGELAARIRAGILGGNTETLPPHLRLYGGGPLGVRGVAANLLGPKLLIADSASLPAGCTPATGACEGIVVDRDDVGVRSTGGTAVFEGGVEARVWPANWLMLAAFVDAGSLRASPPQGAPADVARSESVVTPGIGVQLGTPFGPVRIDAAYNTSPARRYPLLLREPGGEEYIYLGNAVFDPFRDGFRSRIQLQFTMGNTF
ncbi:MAG TPA: POTRA domain-containing protein [Longimicrobium sp.]|nr:POTRA domain-containing protein [Longimicrobium sp.]